MADSLDPGSLSERPGLPRRRSKNPLRNMMQHLTVEQPLAADDDDGGGGSSPRRESLIRRLSRRSRSRSPSATSDASAPSRNSDPALCAACANLAADMESTLQEIDFTFTKAINPGADDVFDKKEYFLTRLPDLAENRWATTCPLCRLFWAVHVTDEDGQGDYRLSAYSSRDTNYLLDPVRMFDMRHPAKNKAKGLAPGFLGVVPKTKRPGAREFGDWFRPSGMLYRTAPEHALAVVAKPRVSGRRTPEPPALALNDDSMEPGLLSGIWGREIGPSADLAVARDWLRFCECHHRGRCGRRPVVADMPGFRLVDCSKTPPQVADGSIADDYAALSYVRGGKPTEAWPSVVRDAADVARDLGLRHLWVDIVCMDGTRPEDRAEQIARMDDIFEGAVLTIIAAHGDDATQGLPGIGSTARPAQPRYRFANSSTTLVSSLEDPQLTIEKSTWNTRAWTYQEGLLARRRLVFTGQQMYWECDGMLCPETLALPLTLYHDSQQQRMCDFVRPGLFNGVSYVDGGWRAWKTLPGLAEDPSTLSVFRAVDRHITDYSRRRLTYDQDSLNAFLGISQRLEKTLGRGRLGHLVGIPIWAPPGARDDASSSRPPRTRELFALSTSFWHHRADDEPRRRPHLPSWSWAGWSGAVELFSSVVVAGPGKPRKLLNHHYMSATQLARNEPSSLAWTYSPAMVVLYPDGSLAYDFVSPGPPPRLPQAQYLLRVSDPLVLDHVRARAHAGGWTFNDVSVDVRLSRGRGTVDGTSSAPPAAGASSAIADYVQRHTRGEQMTVLWLVEEATVMLLVVAQTAAGRWERVGRARMASVQETKGVLRRFGSLEAMLGHLPLRRLGEDIVIE